MKSLEKEKDDNPLIVNKEMIEKRRINRDLNKLRVLSSHDELKFDKKVQR